MTKGLTEDRLAELGWGRINLRVRREVAEAIRELADLHGVTVGQMVTEAVLERMANEGGAWLARVKRMREGVGR